MLIGRSGSMTMRASTKNGTAGVSFASSRFNSKWFFGLLHFLLFLFVQAKVPSLIY